jgi:hypothetical protein
MGGAKDVYDKISEDLARTNKVVKALLERLVKFFLLLDELDGILQAEKDKLKSGKETKDRLIQIIENSQKTVTSYSNGLSDSDKMQFKPFDDQIARAEQEIIRLDKEKVQIETATTFQRNTMEKMVKATAFIRYLLALENKIPYKLQTRDLLEKSVSSPSTPSVGDLLKIYPALGTYYDISPTLTDPIPVELIRNDLKLNAIPTDGVSLKSLQELATQKESSPLYQSVAKYGKDLIGTLKPLDTTWTKLEDSALFLFQLK